MKNCLNCNKEYEPKRESSKFCKTSCRVSWYNKHSKGKNKVTPLNMQEMFNAVMAAVNGINSKNGQPPAIAAAFELPPVKSPVMSYNQAWDSIEASTSSIQLEDAWRQIKKQEWPNRWQLNELEKLKGIQQTKIDF